MQTENETKTQEALASRFDPQAAEAKWYEWWKECGYFQPEQRSTKKPYSITIPPPNVTGSLHMGHALCYTIQDILGRRKRMQGENVLILPGVDHAGIATQNVVEKEIAQEGLNRHEMGREKFLERVWSWKERYGARIIMQLQRLGCAFDWSRERFTMDDSYVDAILEEFIRFFNQGYIYRGARVINWCPRCTTALSDIEVEYVEQDSHLWHIRYPFSDGSGHVIVATTRPETMLGDTAVAVNPEDKRYKDKIGETFLLPLVGREIPLIADSYASMEFGTGAVKVTPAHDLNDFEAGLRHRLPQIVVIGEDGRMTAAAGDKYANLTREEAREAVVRDLEEGGFLVETEDYRHSVGTCERCHTIIEPLLSEQWFVKMAGTPMIERTLSTVKEGKIEFIPDRYQGILTTWLENIRDWCISRQLWWGHRIPIYYAHDGRYAAAKTREAAAEKLGVPAAELRQDEDVLDTWFSSALWPFATLGWPEKTEDLLTFYPTSVLTTAREILFLWVARMTMTGLEFMNEIPFHQVYIYATVLDKLGRRMSKSLGNGIDPLEMIEKYGTDALRFSLVRLASKGQDIRFSEDRIPESRNFCTKIWNASRFVQMNLQDPPRPSATPPASGGGGSTSGQPTSLPPPEAGGVAQASRRAGVGLFTGFSLPQRWITSRLQATIEQVNSSLESYDLDEACRALYEFFWNDYCDWFVELSKPALRSENEAERASAQQTLANVLETSLRLLHPLMPFITEEIWQAIPHKGETIMHAPYPVAEPHLKDEEAERQMGVLIESIRAIRNARAELGVPPSKPIEAHILASPDLAGVLRENSFAFEALAKANPVFTDTAQSAPDTVALPITQGLDIYLPLAGIIDIEKEKSRVVTELATIEKDLARVQGKLGNPNFVAKAAPEIVAKERAAEAELLDKKAKLEARGKAFSGG